MPPTPRKQRPAPAPPPAAPAAPPPDQVLRRALRNLGEANALLQRVTVEHPEAAEQLRVKLAELRAQVAELEEAKARSAARANRARGSRQ